jgi:hypothetical protein
VNVIYGSRSGLTAARNQLWSEASPGVAGKPTNDEIFGGDVAAANYGKDGGSHRYDDLAIGVPRGGPHLSGAVHVLYGAAGGLSSRRSQLWSQASPNVPGTAEFGDDFGLSIAAADFGRGPYADLAVGVASESVGPDEQFNGALNFFYGSSDGLASAGSARWTVFSFGLQPEDEEVLGYDLEAG